MRNQPQHLADTLRRNGYSCSAVRAEPTKTFAYAEGRGGTSWKVTLRKGHKSLTTPFWQGAAHHAPPSCDSVVRCLISDLSCAGNTFEGFCHEFGYDHDTDIDGECYGRADCRCKSVWKHFERMAPKVRDFFGDDLEMIESACNDYEGGIR